MPRPIDSIVYRTTLFLCFLDVVFSSILVVGGWVMWWHLMMLFRDDISWLYHSGCWYYQLFGYYGIWIGFLVATIGYAMLIYYACLILDQCRDSFKSLRLR